MSGQPGLSLLRLWELKVDFNLLCEEGGVHIKWTSFVYSHLLVILALDRSCRFSAASILRSVRSTFSHIPTWSEAESLDPLRGGSLTAAFAPGVWECRGPALRHRDPRGDCDVMGSGKHHVSGAVCTAGGIPLSVHLSVHRSGESLIVRGTGASLLCLPGLVTISTEQKHQLEGAELS